MEMVGSAIIDILWKLEEERPWGSLGQEKCKL